MFIVVTGLLTVSTDVYIVLTGLLTVSTDVFIAVTGLLTVCPLICVHCGDRFIDSVH